MSRYTCEYIPEKRHNMLRQPLKVKEFVAHPCGLWEPEWLLLTCGDFAAGDFNCMTVSWGSLGVIWGKPFALVVVRPQRYTRQFIEKYPTFTLCAFSRKYRKALNLLGTKSGRDGDKIAEAGLTPVADSLVAAPVYQQAQLTLECRKMYWQDIDPTHFLDPAIDRNYPEKDYHRIFYGEILAVTGTEHYEA
jgi:flavin reductase (DIM6/NTAB) family NADH-FMN oxidoreductase RutF